MAVVELSTPPTRHPRPLSERPGEGGAWPAFGAWRRSRGQNPASSSRAGSASAQANEHPPRSAAHEDQAPMAPATCRQPAAILPRRSAAAGRRRESARGGRVIAGSATPLNWGSHRGTELGVFISKGQGRGSAQRLLTVVSLPQGAGPDAACHGMVARLLLSQWSVATAEGPSISLHGGAAMRLRSFSSSKRLRAAGPTVALTGLPMRSALCLAQRKSLVSAADHHDQLDGTLLQ